MRTFDFTVSSTVDARIDCAGTYLRYMSSAVRTGNDIRVQSGPLDVVLLPGQSVRVVESVETWKLSLGPNAGTTARIGTVIIGTGDIADNFQGDGVVSVSGTGFERVRSGKVWVEATDFSAGELITTFNPSLFWSRLSFRHSGSSAARVDVFICNPTGPVSSVSSDRARLDGYSLSLGAPEPFRIPSASPFQKVWIARASIPAGSAVVLDQFFPPSAQLLFSPWVQGADTLGQIEMSAIVFQPD